MDRSKNECNGQEAQGKKKKSNCQSFFSFAIGSYVCF